MGHRERLPRPLPKVPERRGDPWVQPGGGAPGSPRPLGLWEAVVSVSTDGAERRRRKILGGELQLLSLGGSDCGVG